MLSLDYKKHLFYIVKTVILTILISLTFINPTLGFSSKNVKPKMLSTVNLSKDNSLLDQTKAQTSNTIPSGITESSLLAQTSNTIPSGITESSLLAQTSNTIPSDITESSLLAQTKPQTFKEETANELIDKQTFINEKEILENFFNTHKAVDIHNKALTLLNSDQKNQAFLLLKRNLYQNLFFPSYFVLSDMKIPIFFLPFFWHISLFILALIGLVSLYLSIKKDFKTRLLLFFFFLFGIFILLILQFVFLKKRVSSLQEIKLRSSPFLEAPIQTEHPPNLDLIVLQERGEWLRIRADGKQTGWVLKKNIFPIF